MEGLPDYFDVIVVGTGMPECIIAAAAARIGKKVLHLDRNGYYGGDWASFSFDKFLEWIEETKNPNHDHSEVTESSLRSFINEGEDLYLCPQNQSNISNITVKSYIRESPPPSDAVSPEETQNANEGSNIIVEENVTSQVENTEETPQIIVSEDNGANDDHEHDAPNDSNENDMASTPENVPEVSNKQEWTVQSFIENRRKFNIDLAPKLMFSRGSLVELLISSNIARYAEFQCVNRVLTHVNGHVVQVPCSRADVFSTKNVTVVEKRMLMKFLTFCLKFEEEEQEYKDFENQPFLDFLKSKKLTPNVEHYIIHAIAMVDESCDTLQGLKSAQKFLQSLGRYGNSPFLCTCYGSGELPQCFCRLCAVYEGLYYLKRSVDGIVLKNRCCGIISLNQRIGCEWLIMESSYAPRDFIPADISQRISRAIIITDASLYPAEKKENVLLRLPPGPDIIHPITVLEFSSKTYVCPEELYLVYMYCMSSSATAEEDLETAVELLFHRRDSDDSSDKLPNENEKPNVLWCVYFNQKDTSSASLNRSLPDGLMLTSSPDSELDYEHAVKEARQIFEKMFPGEEFLPRAPDPEDIVLENHNNPGHGDEGNAGDDTLDEDQSAEEKKSAEVTETSDTENLNELNENITPSENTNEAVE